jgi:thiol-disulfide isomerase/thioredoxin
MMAFRQATKCPCCLVVEGYEESRGISNKVSGIPVGTLEQCFTSIQVRDNFYIQHVENIYYHAEFIGKCIKTLEKYEIWKEKYGENMDNLNKDFTESLKTRRKANLDESRVFIIQLSTIPDISINIAEKIAEIYPNWKSLITIFEQNGPDCLSEIKVGKNRFGKIKSQKIHQYLNLTPSSQESTPPPPIPQIETISPSTDPPQETKKTKLLIIKK